MISLDTLLNRNKYSLLLVSCVLIIITSPFLKNPELRATLNAVTLVFSIISGLILISGRRGYRARVIRSVGYFTLFMQFMGILNIVPIDVMAKLIPIVYIIYFVSISIIVYTDIYRAKHVDTEMVAAVFCGFIMLGLLCSFTFTLVEIFEPNSFSGLEDRSITFNNLIYFSFITILTIGYGDMAPLTDAAKVITICVGLIGNFYTVFVTGIVIGKFISGRARS